MKSTGGHHTRFTLLAGAVLALVASLLVAAPVSAAGAELHGRVLSSVGPLTGYTVSLMRTAGTGPPVEAGHAVTGGDGSFQLTYPAATPDSVLYLVATDPHDPRHALASLLGTGATPASVVVNERTTVATGFALAQFTHAGAISGSSPGLQNAAAMTRNLVDPATGQIGTVLATAPNGPQTETVSDFNALANMVANCLTVAPVCDQMMRLSAPPGQPAAPNTWQALADIAQYPWHNVAPLFAVSKAGAPHYLPDRPVPPSAWTLALRFVGDGVSMDGAGNMVVDEHGNVWATNNYEWTPNSTTPACGAENLLEFTPTGQYAPGSPYTGGGLSGAGFGIDIDPQGHVWVANFGFAAPPPACPQDRQPPHNSVSEFTAGGAPLSPATGYTQGGVSWPQGLIVDDKGSVWIANCGNDSVTVYPNGDPAKARRLTGIGIQKPFALAQNDLGNLFVTGNTSDTVAVRRPDGTPAAPPVAGGGLDKPLGVAVDSGGNAWVANSQTVGIPCPDPAFTPSLSGSITMIDPHGTLLTPTPLTGGGLFAPWGITVDGNDNVWVANFAGQRLSEFCGIRVRKCRPGTSVGSPISSDVGYGFNGLVRNTGVVVDQSGNVWVPNNWKQVPIQKNPGGYQMVVFIGLAGPVQHPR